ncbi:MAG: hypothetical protein A2252_02415 [Elusimicrobia bacterium RIFOXYA2_FULL_39_19]|nr:MAG: hypothetical protein A2252_02415 [Elusimicrobia bacterium RIFOXYA2_FULL_39_19]
MRLKNLAITGFRSIKDEVVLILDERVSILIGANDHGKSNILAAIQCLNDEFQIKPEDKNWDLDKDSVVKIKWHFSYTDDVKTILKGMSVQEVDSQPDVQPTTATEECFPINSSEEIIYSRDNNSNKISIESLPFRIPISKGKDILQFKPRVELFVSPTTNIVDQVKVTELTQPQFEFMQGIFRLAGIWENRQEMFTQNDKTSRLLDEASERLTKILNDKWNQGRELKWKFEHTGSNGDTIVIKIQDPAIKSQYTRPSMRSSGFKTFFLLSMITSARTQNKPNDSYIFLFDEPGTYLHPHAQLDLQRSLESISENTQIIYTTHSIFLINKNHHDRNLVVNKTKQGTKVDQKPFINNWKSVRASLGILLSNNFLIADKTLLVEGPSDIIYVLNAMKTFKKENKLDIDLNDFSIVDAGCSENYIAMAKLMLSEGREVVALIDGNGTGSTIDKQLGKYCEAEIKSKKLKIKALPSGKSSEDIFCNIENLQESILDVAQELVDRGLRSFKQDIDVRKKSEAIKPHKNDTLGKIIEDITKSFFQPEEKISKLSIALKYEDICAKNSKLIPNTALAELTKIKEILKLRSEKSSDIAILEETTE